MRYTRLFDILPYQLENFAQSNCLVAKDNGQWRSYTTQEVVSAINRLSKAFLALGIEHKKSEEEKIKVALISNNRPEWNFVDNAIMAVGGVNVPIYANITDQELKFIFNDAAISYAFVGDQQLYNKIENIKADVPSLKSVYIFDKTNNSNHWENLLALGNNIEDAILEDRKAKVDPGELATIIYTSGTTGTPKGVMLSHRNIIANIEGCVPILKTVLAPSNKALSFLPLCHILERMVNTLLMTEGVGIYYAESLETIGDNLKEIKPHVFTTVPRLLEKVYDKIYNKGSELGGIKKALFFWALRLGLNFDFEKENSFLYNIQLKLANKLIFSKWREALGSEVKLIVSGGAALQPRLAKVFTAAQIKVLEGYGLSETSPVVCVNRPEKGGTSFGSVGKKIDNVQLKLAADGEICVKGENVMMGYYKRKDLTDEVFDKEGYFLTGDIGEMVNGDFLKITDRKKDLFKSSGGKYISPQNVENKLKESIYIEQALVLGENQKYVGALIVPCFAELNKWALQQAIDASNRTTLLSNETVLKLISDEIKKLNNQLNHVEQVRKFKLVTTEWTVDSGELTPSQKIKRKVIANNNQQLIDKLF
jgi:long-chain acyl-CoA synthetase